MLTVSDTVRLGNYFSYLNYSRDEYHRITFLLAIYTGMRRGEILGLKWGDIGF
ncbi:tyrosine-type recombinase/integrase [Viridibacillus sp. YIM B01967]|uniref:Tyrosine-type recombinase/integrase n=1 Tax=Viridibacillus soli TaxID=2798301 RepID=A0ABS1HCD2_9BACL|nr:tyrosine-type recombinase/integrase [Viridibacillus soli]